MTHLIPSKHSYYNYKDVGVLNNCIAVTTIVMMTVAGGISCSGLPV